VNAKRKLLLNPWRMSTQNPKKLVQTNRILFKPDKCGVTGSITAFHAFVAPTGF
jgi:hypothetical protein